MYMPDDKAGDLVRAPPNGHQAYLAQKMPDRGNTGSAAPTRNLHGVVEHSLPTIEGVLL